MSVGGFESMASNQPTDGPALLVQRLLLEQSELTAVERFSQHHESEQAHTKAKYYRDLIPLTRPAPGEQYAFRVDLDSCSGCKACVSACHELNGLEDEETWRDVGLLVGMDAELPILQHVTSACHHCIDPGCVSGCPVRAYDKNPQTGIVHHLDDQCIGCQYCIWTCPYEVPKYSASKGIVRKCDMCHQRLAVDEAPACVQSCPNQAIAIELVRNDDARSRAERGEFLGAMADSICTAGATTDPATTLVSLAPDPRLTTPTTRYVTRRTGAAMAISADHGIDSPQHAHWPLVLMLVLTQLAVGVLLVERGLTLSFALNGESAVWTRFQVITATASFLIAFAGMAIANLHLGRPWLAFRAVLGWRTSWLSREVLAFGAFVTIDAVYVLLLWQSASWGLPHWIAECVGNLAAAGAVAAALSSAFVYIATKRGTWSARRVLSQFGVSIVLLGLTSGLVILNTAGLVAPELQRSATITELAQTLLVGTALLSCARLVFVRLKMRRLRIQQRDGSPLDLESRIMRLLVGPLKRLSNMRLAFGLLSGVIFPAMILFAPLAASWLSLPAFFVVQSLVLATVLFARLASETMERYLFFVTAVTSKMPGGMP